MKMLTKIGLAAVGVAGAVGIGVYVHRRRQKTALPASPGGAQAPLLPSMTSPGGAVLLPALAPAGSSWATDDPAPAAAIHQPDAYERGVAHGMSEALTNAPRRPVPTESIANLPTAEARLAYDKGYNDGYDQGVKVKVSSAGMSTGAPYGGIGQIVGAPYGGIGQIVGQYAPVQHAAPAPALHQAVYAAPPAAPQHALQPDAGVVVKDGMRFASEANVSPGMAAFLQGLKIPEAQASRVDYDPAASSLGSCPFCNGPATRRDEQTMTTACEKGHTWHVHNGVIHHGPANPGQTNHGSCVIVTALRPGTPPPRA